MQLGLVLCPFRREFVYPSGHAVIYSKVVTKVTKRQWHWTYDKKLDCFYCDFESLNSKTHRKLLQWRDNGGRCHGQNFNWKGKQNEKKNLGAFKYSMKVISEGKGNLIVARRSTKNTLDAKHSLPCIHCYRFYYKQELWRHCKKFPLTMKKDSGLKKYQDTKNSVCRCFNTIIYLCSKHSKGIEGNSIC